MVAGLGGGTKADGATTELGEVPAGRHGVATRERSLETFLGVEDDELVVRCWVSVTLAASVRSLLPCLRCPRTSVAFN